MTCALTKSMHRLEYGSSAAPSRKDVPVVATSLQKIAKFAKKLHLLLENNVNSYGEMPAREDMDLCTDKVLSKGRILQELTKAVKLVSDCVCSYYHISHCVCRQGRCLLIHIYIYTRMNSRENTSQSPGNYYCWINLISFRYYFKLI